MNFRFWENIEITEIQFMNKIEQPEITKYFGCIYRVEQNRRHSSGILPLKISKIKQKGRVVLVLPALSKRAILLLYFLSSCSVGCQEHPAGKTSTAQRYCMGKQSYKRTAPGETVKIDLGKPNSEPQRQFFASTVKYTCYGGARGAVHPPRVGARGRPRRGSPSRARRGRSP